MKFDLKDPKTQRISTIILVVAVLLVGVVSSLLRDEDTQSYLAFSNEGYFTITDTHGISTQVAYVDIVSISYVEAPDFGVPDGGGITDGYRLGQWRSDMFGVYTSCTKEALTTCALVQTTDSAYILSTESDSATQALCDALRQARARIIFSKS